MDVTAKQVVYKTIVNATNMECNALRDAIVQIAKTSLKARPKTKFKLSRNER